MINKSLEDFVAKRIFAEKPQNYLFIIYVLRSIKKCLLIRFNHLYLLAVFWLFTCSIVNAGTVPQILYHDGGTELRQNPQDACISAPYYGNEVVQTTTTTITNVASFNGTLYRIYRFDGHIRGGCYFDQAKTNLQKYVYESQACDNSQPWFIDEQTYQMVCGECPIGEHMDGGVCVPDDSDCPPAGTQAAASAGWITTGNVSGSLSVSSSLCTNNSPSGDLCQATCNSGVVARNSVTGESRLECSSYTFTGNQCVPSDVSSVASPTPEIGVNGNNNAPPENPDDCPPGTGFAQINNTKTCLPGGSEYTDGSTVKTDTTTTTTKTTTTTINSDGTTTSTTTINVTNPEGGLIGSGTSTSTSGIDQAGSDKGKEFDPGPVPIIDTSLPEEGTIPTTTFTNPVFNTNLFQVAGACPAPIAFEAMGQSFSIEFDPICDLSPIIRGILLMLAAIIAIRVVVTS